MKYFLQKLKQTPQDNTFESTLAVIDKYYTFTPCAFKNGDLENMANQNNGSCKIFAFAQIHQLNQQQTLHCFGDYYRKDVLGNPQNSDHQNIRHFMSLGWSGISFEQQPLSEK